MTLRRLARSTRARAAHGLACALLVIATAAPVAGQACVGDCSGNAEVTIDELIRGVGIALGNIAVAQCPPVDRNANGEVSIDELIAAVNAALNGCPPPATATPIATAPTPTRTVVLPPIDVRITAPASLAIVNQAAIIVTGTVTGTGVTVSVGGRAATITGGTFRVEGVALLEGPNTVTAVATDTLGQTATDSIAVTLDTAPPRLVIEAPAAGARTAEASIAVAGMLNDIVSGVIGADDVVVQVNGVDASLVAGSFVAGAVPLAVGVNTITARATDVAGNQGTASITVTRLSAAVADALVAVSGNEQQALPGTTLQPLVVRLRDALGNGVAGSTVHFRVTRGDGVFADGSRELAATTAADGRAAVTYTLGSRAGVGLHRVSAESPDGVGVVDFCETAVVGAAVQLHIESGDRQRAPAGDALPEPLVVIARDPTSNAVAGAAVTFTRQAGSGGFAGATTTTVSTDANGRAAASYTTGNGGADAEERIVARLASGGDAMVFTATAVVAERGAPTTFSGVVLDNANLPLRNTRLFVAGAEPPIQTLADANGRFTLTVPPGPFDLDVVGPNSVQTGGGDFPGLRFQAFAVAGRDNSLPEPIYLPAVDKEHELLAGGAQDVDVPIDGIDGARLRVYANSVRRPDGSTTARVSVSQVNQDKVPMPFPGGVAPPLVLTIQPADARFDPPAQLVLPNLDGKPPGFIQNLLSFDHDREEYVIVGTATVSEDGSELVTDRGFGVIKGGWHGSPTDPNPPGRVDGTIDDPDVPPTPPDDPSPTPTLQPTSTATRTPTGRTTRPPTATATGTRPTATRTRPPTRTATPRTPTRTRPPTPTRTRRIDPGPMLGQPTPNNGRLGPPNEGGTTDPAGGGGGPNEDPTRETTHTGGDDIVFATGELVIEATDLSIPGRGFDFVMKRVYRSQYNFDGVLGYNWDFSYNDRLFVPAAGAADQDVLRANGVTRVDRFDRNANGAFASPPGSYTGLRRNPDQTFTVRARDGFRRHYAADGRLTSLVDRHGNTMRFAYAQGRLSVVTDTLGRPIRFSYNDVGRLEAVTDFIGRQVRYYYDGNGDLIAVRSPVVVGTSTGNDFPDGKITRYEYSQGFDAEADPRNAFLNHNLLSITDPLNQRYLVNAYGTQLGGYSFDRIVTQQWGREDQVSTYAYTELNPGMPNTDPDLPRNRTIETDRNGNRRTYVHNAVGNLLERRVETNRDVNPDDPDEFVTSYDYNADGELLATTFPEGNRLELAYDTANPERAQRGNVIAETHLPGPRGGDQTQIRRTFQYEPVYNQLRASTDPRGTDLSFTPPTGGAASAARYTTTAIFDYQEGANLAAIAAELGLSPADTTARLAAAGVTLNLGDRNGDGVTTQVRGDVVRRDFPTVQLLAGSQQAQIEGDTSQEIARTFVWNRFGQLAAETDPEGNVTDYEYYPERDADGDGIASMVPGLADDTGGYLAATITDSRVGAGRREASPPRMIRRELAYDEVGNVIRAVDGRGGVVGYERNALNQTVRETLEAPFNYEIRSLYDANDNLVARGVQNVDTNGPGLGGFVYTRWEYDVLDSRTKVIEEVSAGEALVTDLEYDRNQNLIRTTRPEGNRVEQAWDERDLLFTITRGAGTPQASTVTTTYDGSGIVARVVDGADTDGDGQAEATVQRCDGYDRVVERVDGIGNRQRLTYDPAGNVVRRRHFGPNGGASPVGAAGAGNVLLADVTTAFDEHHRAYQTSSALFANTTAVGPEGPLTPGDGAVAARREFDRLGRLTRSVDDNAHQTLLEYDGASRLVRRTDALGNEQRFEHDANDNVVASIATDRSPEGIVPVELFITATTFDALDRPTSGTDSLGNVTVWTYDSRGNRIGTQDPLGNRTVRVFDGQNRLLEERIELRAGGTGGGGFDVDNPANPDGEIVTRREWDGNSRLIAIVDDRGNRTATDYDALDRPTVTTFADGSDVVREYDADDNVVRLTDPNGSVVARDLDGANRLIAEDVTRAAGVLGTTQRRYQYDGLARLTRASDNNLPADAGDDSLVERDYDSLGRLLRERQNGTAIATRVDGVGNPLALTYPSGRVVELVPDALDRVETIRDQGSPTPIADYDSLGGGRVLERRYGNGTRLRYHAGGADVGYDGARRVVRHRHETAAGSVLLAGFDYAYDRVGNRRYELDAVSAHAEVFEYDSAYRLTRGGAQVAAAAVAGIAANTSTNADVAGLGDADESAFVLDGAGNWASRADDGQPLAFARNEVNEYTAIGGAAQTHDDNGNRRSDAAGRYVYDVSNRLVRVDTPAGVEVARYAYDALGRRISVRRGADTVRAYYAGERLIEERSGAGATLRQYVFGRGLDELLEIASGGARYFVHDDSLGSLVALSDAAGAVVERYAYDVYGVPTVLDPDGVERAASVVGQPFRFTGQRHDAESGLYFYRARSYDPRAGRFLQRDPKGFVDGVGWYAYAGNNPVNFTDPMGTEKEGGGGDDPCGGSDGSRPRAASIAEQAGILQGESSSPTDGSAGAVDSSAAASSGLEKKVKRKRVTLGNLSPSSTAGAGSSRVDRSRELARLALTHSGDMTRAHIRFEQGATAPAPSDQRRQMLERLTQTVRAGLEQHTGASGGAPIRRETRQIYEALRGLNAGSSGAPQGANPSPLAGPEGWSAEELDRQTALLGDMIHERADLFDELSAMMDQYDESAAGMIDELGGGADPDDAGGGTERCPSDSR